MDKRDPSLPTPLLLPALAFSFGILLQNIHPYYPQHMALFTLLFLLSSLCFLAFSKIKAKNLLLNVLLLLLIFSCGFLRSHVPKRIPENHISRLLAEQDTIRAVFTGTVMSNPTATQHGYRYILELHRLSDYPISGKVMLYTENDTLSYQDKIRATLKVVALPQVSNPESFDYREYLINKGISGMASYPVRLELLGKARLNSINDLLLQCRYFLFRHIDHRFGNQSQFVKAMLFGERADMQDMTQVLTRGGLLHLIAISGMNILLLYGILFTLLNLILPRNPVRITLLFIMIFYAGLCDWTPSVVRAVIMVDLFLLAGIAERRIGALQLIGTSLLIIGLIDPSQVKSIGLQLSYACVFVLMVIFPKVSSTRLMKGKVASTWKKLLFNLLDLFVLSVCISIYIMPLTLYYFNQFGLNGIIANLLGIPLMTFLMPLSILILLLPSPLWIPFDNAYHLLNNWFQHWALLSGKLPFFWDFIYFPWWKLLLAITTLILLSYLLIDCSKRKLLRWMPLFIMLVLPIFIVQQPKLTGTLILFFDVGIGDCALIQTQHTNVMIDTGPTASDNPVLTYAVVPYLKKNGMNHLDYLFLTHPHSDHIGGVSYLVENMTIDSIIVNKHFTEDIEGKKLLTMISHSRNNHVRILADTTSFRLDDFTIRVIHPDSSFTDENPNNESMVMVVSNSRFKGIFTGDVEESAEDYLLHHSVFSKKPYTFIKVPHHGSKTSANPSFLQQIAPAIAVISSSQYNRFHFPNPHTIEIYQTMGAKVFVTGSDGAIQMDFTNDILKLKTWKSRKVYTFGIR